MTVKEQLKTLKLAENYYTERVIVSDDFINMVKVMLPSDYEDIEEKENDYIEICKMLSEII